MNKIWWGWGRLQRLQRLQRLHCEQRLHREQNKLLDRIKSVVDNEKKLC